MFNWLKELVKKWQRKSELGQAREIKSLNELPDRLGSYFYIVVNEGHLKWLVFSCPCGCGDKIEVNLMKSIYPVWRLTRSNKGVTLMPSLWRGYGTCGSHFWIRDNKIVWVN